MGSGLFKKIESMLQSAGREFAAFAVVGAFATILNYGVFFALFKIFGQDYLLASAIGYIAGVLAGYVLNARVTFQSATGKNVFPYVGVYLVSLIMSLSLLRFQTVSLAIDPLVANAVCIAFTTITNYLGCKFLVFNKNLRVPEIFKSKLFLAVLALKIIFAFLLASDFLTQLFLPFVKYFVANPLANPYQHFLDIGNLKAFPYPPLMLFILSVPFVLFGIIGQWFGGANFELLLIRLPLLAADIVILYVLSRMLGDKDRELTWLYWCSPIVFYISFIHGQLDAIPISLLLLSLYFLTRGRETLSAVFLGFSLATKSNILLALPFVFLYLLKRKTSKPKIAGFCVMTFALYAFFLVPYVFSEGFLRLVFMASEQFGVFEIFIQFPENLAYLVTPALYLYFVFKAQSFRKLTNDILFMIIGASFILMVVLVKPMQGWYYWSVPFIVFFFAREKRAPSRILYHTLSAGYLLYFLLIPQSDVFNVFQVIGPSLAALQTPFFMLQNAGVNAGLVTNVAFTILASNLIYIGYAMYRHGVRSSLVFQESRGLPTIGIAGDSGAGKTVLANSLVRLFGRENVTVVSGDDVHKWERGDVNWNRYTHLNPISNKIYPHYEQVRELKKGLAVQRRKYDHDTGKFTEPALIQPRDYIIDEGLLTFFIGKANSLYDLKVFVEPDERLRTYWKVKRDVLNRNYTVAQVLKNLRKRAGDSQKFVSPQRNNADLIISFMPLHAKSIDYRDLKKALELKLQADVTLDISLEDLTIELSKCKWLKVEFEYLNDEFQRVVFKGTASAEELAGVLRRLDVNLDDYGVRPESISSGYDGIVQTLVLYCLNEKIKTGLSEGDGIAF